MPYKYTNDTRNMLEGYFNGKEPLERKKPAFGESKNYFIDPNDSTQTIEVPDGTDPYAFRDAGYKSQSLTDIGSGLTTETGTGLNTSLTNNSSTSLTDQTGIGSNSLNTSTGLFSNKTSSNTPSLFGSTKTNTDNPWAGLGDDTITSTTSNPWAALGDDTTISVTSNPWAALGDDTTTSTTSNPWAALGDDTTTSVTSNPWAGLEDINDTNTLSSGLFNNSNNSFLNKGASTNPWQKMMNAQNANKQKSGLFNQTNTNLFKSNALTNSESHFGQNNSLGFRNTSNLNTTPVLTNEWDSSRQKMQDLATKTDTNNPYGEALDPLLAQMRSSLTNSLSGMSPVYPEIPPQYHSVVQPTADKMTQSLTSQTQQLENNWQQQALSWLEYIDDLKRNAYLGSARNRYETIYPVQNKMNTDYLSSKIDTFLPQLRKHEGYKKNPYFDIRCFLTGGTGRRLTCEEVQKDTSMNMTQAKKDRLCQIEKEFQEKYCLKDADGRYTPKPGYEKLNKQYDTYPELETYYYPKDKAYADSKKHIFARLPQVMDVLNEFQTDFYALPEPIQQFLMDIAYNPGMNTPVYRYNAPKTADKRKKTGWPNFMQSLQDMNYEEAANQVSRQGVGQDRNTWARDQILKGGNIIQEQKN